jgi:hypothetical protein
MKCKQGPGEHTRSQVGLASGLRSERMKEVLPFDQTLRHDGYGTKL